MKDVPNLERFRLFFCEFVDIFKRSDGFLWILSAMGFMTGKASFGLDENIILLRFFQKNIEEADQS